MDSRNIAIGGFMADLPPMIKWVLGIIVGGGGAAMIKTGASMARLKSTAFTAGWANWIIATFEHIASFVMSILSVLVPVVMGFFTIALLLFFGIRLSRKKNPEPN